MMEGKEAIHLLGCVVLCCVVLCCVVLCCVVLCCVVLCCVVLCCVVLCCVVLCCVVLCCVVLCCVVLCCAVLCCAVLCCAVLCCAVLCCAVLCCAVLCCAVLCCVALCCVVLGCVVLCVVSVWGRKEPGSLNVCIECACVVTKHNKCQRTRQLTYGPIPEQFPTLFFCNRSLTQGKRRSDDDLVLKQGRANERPTVKRFFAGLGPGRACGQPSTTLRPQ